MSENDFDEFVNQAVRLDQPVLMLFTAPAWCVPCRQLEPHWKKAVETLGDKVSVIKVDMGEKPEDTGSHWATARFGIRGVPSIKLITPNNVDPLTISARSAVVIIREVEGNLG